MTTTDDDALAAIARRCELESGPSDPPRPSRRDGGVVRLVTMRERAEAEDRDYRERVQEEAVAMLERALAMARERRVAGLAVSVVFEDGCFGWLAPDLTTNLAGLIGAASSTVAELHKRGESPGDL